MNDDFGAMNYKIYELLLISKPNFFLQQWRVELVFVAKKNLIFELIKNMSFSFG
jgi:hypothetical protein